MVTTNQGILPPAPDRIGGICQTVPPEVHVAWQAHRPYVRKSAALADGAAEGYVATLIGLQRAIRRHGRKPGYFVLDGFLVGYGNDHHDPVWTVTPDRCPIRREGRP